MTPPTDDLPRVTLNVKAYRQERIVGEAIESAFAQTYPNLEIILSDDASPDGTFRVMEQMAAAYRGPHTVRLNRNPVNLGLVGHTNRIWELAEGRLVTGCAGDDIAEPDKVARLVEAWRAGAGRVTLVHSWATKIDLDGHVIGEARPDPRIVEDPSPLNIIAIEKNCIGATTLYDRQIYDVFGPLPSDCLVEDGPQFFRAALLGDIAFVDAPLMRYRMGGVSNPKPTTVGQRYLRGHRMTGLAWWIGNAKSFLRDLEKVGEFPDKAEVRRRCRRFIEDHEVEVAVWRAGGPLRRLLLLPWAAWRSVRTRRPVHFAEACKHLLGPLYIRYYDWRMRRAWARGAARLNPPSPPR